MAVGTVIAAVGNAYGNIYQFFGEGIYFPRFHYCFERSPCPFKDFWLASQCLPEIIDPICISGRHNIVVDFSYLFICF